MPSPYKHFNDSEIRGLQDRLVTMLDNARELAKIPFIITSGLRTASQNEQIGGVDDSAHLKGLAVDLRCRNSAERFIIVSALLMAGFKRIEITNDHVHTDIDSLKPQNVIFLK